MHAQRIVTFCGEKGKSRAEPELLANSLAEALRVPQTKLRVNEEAAQTDGETLFAVLHATARARRGCDACQRSKERYELGPAIALRELVVWTMCQIRYQPSTRTKHNVFCLDCKESTKVWWASFV
jgi:hypothetical protein